MKIEISFSHIDAYAYADVYADVYADADAEADAYAEARAYASDAYAADEDDDEDAP